MLNSAVMTNITTKKKVLFLCTGNSARSQMAEALLRHMAAEHFEVFSAGTQPEQLDPRASLALEKFGISTTGLIAKDIKQFDGQTFDIVITLCNKANDECRSHPGARKQLAWDLPDPKTRSDHQPFVNTISELERRLTMFLSVEQNTIANAKPHIEQKVVEVEPITFYKSLTDEIRLKTLMLAHYHGELCVCELMVALEQSSQPKVSRHLAVLKKAQIITDRKHGQWVFYQINPALPFWAKAVIAQTTENNADLIAVELARLDTMKNRPDKVGFCN